ncbi:1280_t:CDS:2 [Cetraspora pellucida]|uniref:1280_t:CDS:1 n=1 Tax=Cetraspora pellucida TaxID=1433469 RepID=A0ACA9KH12_9GLOM|nr:1280_t:CDS:2 [Cetraspora pellucida]
MPLQANQASICKDTQVRLAELKEVALNTIPYSCSNSILTQYQEEIKNIKNKVNYSQKINSIDKLADWLAGSEKGYKLKKLNPVSTTIDK